MEFVQVGEPAPDVAVLDTEGREVPLSSFWSEHAVVLGFARHFG